MAIQDLTVAQQVAGYFAEVVRDEPTVKQLWVLGELGRVEPGRESVDIWLFLDRADEATEDRIIATASPLGDQFPNVHLMLHVTNGEMPANFEPGSEVYPGAEPILLTRR